VSNHKRPPEYARFVKTFQNYFEESCAKYLETWMAEDYESSSFHTARGDEGLLMIFRSRMPGDLSEEVDIAINIALEVKRRWLVSEENRDRIRSGLLPIDVAVGIHTGPTHVQDGKPEGYTINLAKRVESHSREGKFTHIFVSEAAHGHLASLAEECTYLFDESQLMTAKGISRPVRAYEVKHHFLPSDWREESSESKRAKSLLDPTAMQVAIVKDALKINPTNLWLAEEFILASMLTRYWALKVPQREKNSLLRKAFAPAKERADLLRQSDQRDAGVLFIQGLVEGEYNHFESERSRYQEALKESDQLDLAHWYLGQSFSQEVYDALQPPLDLEQDYESLDPGKKELVDNAIDHLEQAQMRQPHSAWMKYDYGCELIRWERSKPERTTGLDNIRLAVDRLPEVAERIRSEPYLRKAMKDVRIRRLLPRHKKKKAAAQIQSRRSRNRRKLRR